MNDFPQPENAALVGSIIIAGITACVATWVWIGARWGRGERVLPYEPRRPVPWRFSDLSIILLVYLGPALAGLVFGLARFGATGDTQDAASRSGELGVSHPVLDLLASNPGSLALAFCILVVVVVAPVVEEFLFRLVLQGWLERVERHAVRTRGVRPRIRGLMPVLLTAVLFASLHFRAAQPRLEPERVMEMLTQVAVWNLIVLGVGIAILRVRRGASLVDFGIAPEKVFPDIGLGLLTFFAIAAPIYLLQAILTLLVSDYFAPDPITLVFFAAALGLLYFRTHRIVAPITMHVALNGTSLFVAWLAAG